MTWLRRALLAVVLAGAALAAVPAAAHARSATATDAVPVVADAAPATAPGILTSQPAGEVGAQATLGCPLPYLATGYGPVAQCTLVDGAAGRAGFHSPLTRQFSPSTGWLRVHAVGWYSWNNGTIRGWTSLETAYGPAVWATQYLGGQGRWGIVNLITSRFYPGSGWMPIVR